MDKFCLRSKMTEILKQYVSLLRREDLKIWAGCLINLLSCDWRKRSSSLVECIWRSETCACLGWAELTLSSCFVESSKTVSTCHSERSTISKIWEFTSRQSALPQKVKKKRTPDSVGLYWPYFIIRNKSN